MAESQALYLYNRLSQSAPVAEDDVDEIWNFLGRILIEVMVEPPSRDGRNATPWL